MYKYNKKINILTRQHIVMPILFLGVDFIFLHSNANYKGFIYIRNQVD